VTSGLAENCANLLFSGDAQGIRPPNPEIQGGSIELVAISNNKVQSPPSSLDRMDASFQKQIAFDKRVLKNEDEVAGITSSISGFLQGIDLEQPVFICVTVGERMRGTQPVCGQL
jgi:hypothetical protein